MHVPTFENAGNLNISYLSSSTQDRIYFARLHLFLGRRIQVGVAKTLTSPRPFKVVPVLQLQVREHKYLGCSHKEPYSVHTRSYIHKSLYFRIY